MKGGYEFPFGCKGEGVKLWAVKAASGMLGGKIWGREGIPYATVGGTEHL